MTATSGKESELLSILLSQTNDSLHLLVIHAQLLAEVLDHCRNTDNSSSRYSVSSRAVATSCMLHGVQA
jgi:hypothetical protein